MNANNQIINENITKIYEKLHKLKLSLTEDEDEHYENFYTRISFYFSSIINELKLSFMDNIKTFQQKEEDLNGKLIVTILSL